MAVSPVLPDPVLVNNLLSRYSPVRLTARTDHLKTGDRRALTKLVEAATWINRIYWKQRSPDGWRLKQRISRLPGKEARQLERLLDINYGPWDGFDDDRPFWGNKRRPSGGQFYPPDLTRDEFERYLERHPRERDALLSHTTIVRRRGRRLVAIPYEELHKDALQHVARNLREASELATHRGFREFLRVRARDLVHGPLAESERRWIGVGDSPIDIAIGPYEVYDDALMGLKASYEATVMVRHPLTDELAELESAAPDLERRLPGAVSRSRSRRTFAIGVYDVAYAAGMTNMGSKAIAATLPNDERVRTDVGARLLLFRNVIAAKFAPILEPLAARILGEDQRSHVREDAFLAHTLLHEMAHAVGRNFVLGQRGAERTINEALRERYSAIEECRADLIGLVFLDTLMRRRILPRTMRKAAAVTFVTGLIRTLRFGTGDDHSRGAAIILSQLLRTEAVSLNAYERLLVDARHFWVEIDALAQRVHGIAVHGDYGGAGKVLDDLGVIPATIAPLLPRLTDVPVDVEFVFEDSPGLR